MKIRSPIMVRLVVSVAECMQANKLPLNAMPYSRVSLNTQYDHSTPEDSSLGHDSFSGIPHSEASYQSNLHDLLHAQQQSMELHALAVSKTTL